MLDNPLLLQINSIKSNKLNVNSKKGHNRAPLNIDVVQAPQCPEWLAVSGHAWMSWKGTLKRATGFWNVVE